VHQDERPSPALGVRELLISGEIEVKGRMPWSSNATFLTEVRCGDDVMSAIYKPLRGERPLWDFPNGLYRREVAAHVLSELLGWGIVPITVARGDDAPLGEGSLQAFVPADFEQHYFTLFEDEANHDQLRRMAAFDVVANNTDRKSGHCLVTPDRHIWGIDNGLCFSVDWKVRTVIWEFVGEALPVEIADGVGALLDRLPGGLEAFLDEDEIAALAHRAEDLLDEGTFPMADPYGRCYPWPLV
jgi:uncharacterized repeat protein (TIGR03843 family)